jgi:hypothetical protein
MQSELACHIGLMGKFFCRICKVKGFDAADAPATRGGPETPGQSANPTEVVGEHSAAGSPTDANSDADSQGSRYHRNQGVSKKKLEGLSEMVERVRNFVQVCCCDS